MTDANQNQSDQNLVAAAVNIEEDKREDEYEL